MNAGATLKAVSGLEIFAGSSYRESVCPTEAKIGSSYRDCREIEGFEKSGVKL